MACTVTAAPPASQPAFPDEQLRLLVGQLADSSYQARQSASDRLAELDPRQIDRLAPLCQATSMPEVRMRLREIAQRLFIAAKRSESLSEGFLGLTFTYGTEPTVPGHGMNAAIISAVLPDSPAAGAGLQPGDRVILLFGQPLSSQPGEMFGDRIGRMAPGDPVKLGLLHDNKLREVLVTLTNRGNSKFTLPRETRVEWINQFTRLWRQKFDPSDATAPEVPATGGETRPPD